jgi:hypothetical protein
MFHNIQVKTDNMSDLKIEKNKWQPNFKDETWITDETRDRTFTVTLKQGEDVEIECNWDYGYGGRGTERMQIPIETLKELIKDLDM